MQVEFINKTKLNEKKLIIILETNDIANRNVNFLNTGLLIFNKYYTEFELQEIQMNCLKNKIKMANLID